jgi:hypothetical protein
MIDQLLNHLIGDGEQRAFPLHDAFACPLLRDVGRDRLASDWL